MYLLSYSLQITTRRNHHTLTMLPIFMIMNTLRDIIKSIKDDVILLFHIGPSTHDPKKRSHFPFYRTLL